MLLFRGAFFYPIRPLPNSHSIVTGTHGDELEGQYFAYLLSKTIQDNIECLNGTVDIYPALNPLGIDFITRGIPSFDLDMNRMFPGYDLGETTQRIADGVFKKLEGYEYGIQLASFYQPGNFLSHVKIMETGFTDSELLKRFGMEYGIVRKPRPYDTTTLNYNWQIWETKAFSLYTNATDTIDPDSARSSVDAILRFMYESDIITQKVRVGYKTEVISEECIEQVHTETGGIFISSVKIGQHISKDSIIGKIIDPLDGETRSEISSPVDGIIYFEYTNPLINENIVCFKIIKDQHDF